MDANVAAPPETRRRQWGSDTRVDPLPAVAPPASDALMAIGRIAIVFTVLAWLVLRLCLFLHRHHQQLVPEQHRLPVGDHRLRRHHLVPGAVRAALSGRPAGGAVPQPGPPTGAARRHRRFLRHHPADDDGAGPVLPGRDRGRPQDAAVGSAAGVPVPAGRAAAGRPAEPDVGRAQGHPGRCPAVVRRPDRVARRAAGAVRRPPSSSSRRPNSMTSPRTRGPAADRQIRALAGRVRLGRGLVAHADGRGESSTTTSTGSSPTRCSACWPPISPRSARP